MSSIDWKTLPKGTSVRVKLPGVNGSVAGYLVTKTKRPAYYVGGTLRLPVVGRDYAVPVKDVELIPQAAQADANATQQPAPTYSYTPQQGGP